MVTISCEKKLICEIVIRSSPGAQTERRGDAGSVRVQLVADTHRLLFVRSP
jgi:hypothetical protein